MASVGRPQVLNPPTGSSRAWGSLHFLFVGMHCIGDHPMACCYYV